MSMERDGVVVIDVTAPSMRSIALLLVVVAVEGTGGIAAEAIS
jgi:hypothetical protein